LPFINLKRYLLISLLLPTLMFPLPRVAAAPDPADPTAYDSYQGQWFGIRPRIAGPRQVFFDQSVWQHKEDVTTQGAEIGLAAKVELMDLNPPTNIDEVYVQVLTVSNSRLGIRYEPVLDQNPTAPASCTASMQNTGLNGDDQTARVDFPSSPIVFYGSAGTKSGVYDHFRVSTNGFISFTDDLTAPTPSSLQRKPPNAVVAPLWRDLTMDGSSKVWYLVDSSNVVVSWCNMITKANGQRQTFTVWFHRGDNPLITKDQTPIEFIYGTVTQGTASRH